MSALWFSFRQYTSTLFRCIQNVKKSVTNNFIGEKEKWINKGNDKHEDAHSSYAIQQAYTMFVQILKILGAVVPEKSLTKNNNYWRKRTRCVCKKHEDVPGLRSMFSLK